MFLKWEYWNGMLSPSTWWQWTSKCERTKMKQQMFLRWVVWMPWIIKVTNATVWENPHESKTWHITIIKRQSLFFGDIVRREALENIEMTGKINCQRHRHKLCWMVYDDGMEECNWQLIQHTTDWDLWIAMEAIWQVWWWWWLWWLMQSTELCVAEFMW